MANVLLLHLDGLDGATTTIDSSLSNHTITFNDDAQLDTAQKKFGDSSCLFDNVGDYLTIPDSTDWDWGTGDFTLNAQIRIKATGNHCIFSRDSGANYFYFALEGNSLRFRDYGTTIDFNRSFTFVVDTWYHIEVTRSGNDFRMFIDGVQQGATYTNSSSFLDRSVALNIGRLPASGAYDFDGHIDEARILKGKAAHTSNFTPPTEAYEADEVINEEETLGISESIQFQETRNLGEETLGISEEAIFKNAQSFESEETLGISEGQLEIQENFHKEETLNISEEFIISQSLEKIDKSENLFITENAVIGEIGDIDLIYPTDFRTKLKKIYKYMTNLITQIFSSNKYNTKLITKVALSNKYNTDLRVKVVDFDTVQAGNLNDFIVKLDGTELTDVDYSTLRVQYNLNKTPSNAQFVLARRHDNFDYKIDGSTYSQISDENKIEVYDGTYKFFTGYITQINAQSQTDTVQVFAEDARYKLSRNSMEIEYGGKYEPTEDDPEIYEIFEKNIGTVFNEILSAMSSYIAGYESLPFTTSHVPEYTKSYNDYSSLLDTLIRQTANANWYLDENEYLRFQKLGDGTIKNLSLSALTGNRYVYDVILSNVSLNHQQSGYSKSFNVKLGKHTINKWHRSYFEGWMDDYVDYWHSLKEKTDFCFQTWGWGYAGTPPGGRTKWYCGVNVKTYGTFDHFQGWILKPIRVVQHQHKDSDEDIDDITVGSGYPKKTIHLNSYGKKETNLRWEERIKVSDEKSYLVEVFDGEYDYNYYALDVANFELSQNNNLTTSANITLLLNAYKYHSLTFKDRINLINTINPSIYCNNNGFPLNISSINIDCSNRIVTLNLSNQGKSWYVRTVNYLENLSKPYVRYLMEKKDVVQYE